MKKATFVSGSIFTSLFLLSILFKVMHWPFASMGLVISVAGLVFVFIPLFAIYQYNKHAVSQIK